MINNEKRLKIAFLTALTLQNDKSSWKITNRYITQALEKYCGEVTQIGFINIREVIIGKILNKISLVFLKKRFLYYHSLYIAKKYAQVVNQRLAAQSFDVIIAPCCATEIAFLETNSPIILVDGATFVQLHNYYPQFSNLLSRSVYEANMLQELALKKASLILYASEWAALPAIIKYHADRQKVHVLPYGANMDEPPSLEDVVMARRKSNRCKLLFVGTDWQRKGGDIAFETLVKLEEMGILAELTICGCTPPTQFFHERMTVIPFLDKQDKEQYKELEVLFKTADFFFLPTRSEVYGIVFNEASAFGLPIITTDTGGVSGAVRNGENGFMLPFSAGGAEYAELISKIYRDEYRYAELVQSSRATFDECLNWDAWAIAVNELIMKFIEHNGS